MTALRFTGQGNKSRPKKPDSPRIWLRVDKALVAKVIKARRDLCIGEEVRMAP